MRPRPSATLEELEGVGWGEPNFDSNLVHRCHRLRRKPLCDLDVEDLRILLGQGIGLPHLLPIALEILEESPLAGGDFHDGDLLDALLRQGVVAQIRSLDRGLYTRLRSVASAALTLINERSDADEVPIELRDSVLGFLRED